MNFEILDLGLVYYKNIMPNSQRAIDLINNVVERFRAGEHGNANTRVQDWEPWWDDHMPKPFNYKFYVFRKENVPLDDYYRAELLEISDVLYGSLDAAFRHYCTLYPWAVNSVKGEEPNDGVLRYEQDGGHLPAHQDLGVSSRVLSTVSYLNDDYEGGEIEFRHSNVIIKPEAGSIVFFPSNFLYVHEVMAVKSGTRYAMPHWYHHRVDIVESTGEE